MSTENNETNIKQSSRLQEAVRIMDAYSQEGFNKIVGISGVISKSLEAREIDRHALSFAIKAIMEKAEDAMNSINCEAEAVGCNFKDESKH